MSALVTARYVVTADTLGLLLADVTVGVEALRAELGDLAEPLAAYGSGPAKEYRRLRGAGVNHETAAYLAAHHRKAG